jgi:DNA-binding GntR family transcriptional regulator
VEDILAEFQNHEIERASTAAHVAQLLRERILAGQLPPGFRLREAALSSSIGVSRNTLREALRIVEREGLIKHMAHRGAVVTKLTAIDVRELYAIRRILELSAIKVISDNPSRSLEDIESAVVAMEQALEEGDLRELIANDFAFHRAIVDRLGHSRLSVFYGTIQTELLLALAHLDRAYDPTSQVGDHRKIWRALREGNGDRASTILRRHLDAAEKRLSSMVHSQEQAVGHSEAENRAASSH